MPPIYCHVAFFVALLIVSGSANETTAPTAAVTTSTPTTPTTAEHTRDQDAFRVSPPDIYPMNSTTPFHGDVKIRMVANQPHSDIYYTTDGTLPSPTSASSKLYTDPFSIFKPGTWEVIAIAFPRYEMNPSVPRVSVATVLASDVPPPNVFPPRGQYRGSVNINILAGDGTDKFASEPHKYQYAIDVEDMWQAFDPAQGILIDTPGVHKVYVRAIAGDGKDGRTSPAGRYTYTITPVLLYDVFSECAKCNYEPTVGQWFTVFLQNAAPGAQLWLSTSSKGCDKADEGRHVLDNTKVLTVRDHVAFYPYVTTGDPQPHVYVCLNESVAGAARVNTVDLPPPKSATKPVPFAATKVPRRIKADSNSMSDGSFAIEAAIGAIDPNVANYKPPTRAPTSSGKLGQSVGGGDFGDLGYVRSQTVTYESGSLFSLITFFALMVVAVVFVYVGGKIMAMRESAQAAERASSARVEMQQQGQERSVLTV